jgi:prepilin-type N-terminal cleavage/methylation domain-containing protein
MKVASGFTLLELIISITITGMVVSAGYAALTVLLDRREMIEAELDTSVRSANARRTLRTWLSGARLTLDDAGPGFTGMDGVAESMDDDALTFLTGSGTPLGQGAVIRLFVDRDEATAEQGLVARVSQLRGSKSLLIPIESSVVGLDIQYHGSVIEGVAVLPSWISRTILPSGIEIKLTGDSLPSLWQLSMLVPIGASR